jgi:hypothetical protein
MMCRQSTGTLPLRLAVSAQLRVAALQLVALCANASEPSRAAVKAEDVRASMRLPLRSSDCSIRCHIFVASQRWRFARLASLRIITMSLMKVIAVALARCARPIIRPERLRYNLRRGISIARTKKLRVWRCPSVFGGNWTIRARFGGFPSRHRRPVGREPFTRRDVTHPAPGAGRTPCELPAELLRELVEALGWIRPYGRTSSMILPMCALDSIKRCASAASASGKTR